MIAVWLGAFAGFAVAYFVLAKVWLAKEEGGANASSPIEVLKAFQWEVPGTFEDGVYRGRHKDRAVEISLRGSSYRIELEGIPSAGDLAGEDAIRLVEELARSRDSRLLDEIPDWQAIVTVFRAHPIRFEKGRLVCIADFGGGVLGTHEETIRLRRLLDRLVDATQVARVAFSLRQRAAVETRCPYCHDEFAGDRSQTTECPKCGALHHVECFVEHGKCAVFACSARNTQALRDLSGPGKPPPGSIR